MEVHLSGLLPEVPMGDALEQLKAVLMNETKSSCTFRHQCQVCLNHLNLAAKILLMEHGKALDASVSAALRNASEVR